MIQIKENSAMNITIVVAKIRYTSNFIYPKIQKIEKCESNLNKTNKDI